uniref:Lectin_legB domain-containing protein n=1 Tax=Panagrellus redivivus TaxID=6233 RepID=A0A7E4UWC9_PANRE
MIRTVTGIHNVQITQNETIFELPFNGESRTYFSMLVPVAGFEFLSETPITIQGNGILGLVSFAFDEPLISNQTLIYAALAGRSLTFMYDGRAEDDHPYIGTSDSRFAAVTTLYKVFPNGTVRVRPSRDTAFSYYFPSLDDAPVFGTDRRILNLRIAWYDLTAKFRIKFPASIHFLSNDSTETTTTELSPTMEDVEITVTTSNKRILKENWWLIVNISASFSIISGLISGFLIYQMLRLDINIGLATKSATLTPEASSGIDLPEEQHNESLRLSASFEPQPHPQSNPTMPSSDTVI